MNEMQKTLAFAGVAVALLGVAALATRLPDLRGPGDGFDDQGRPFFPTFAEKVEEDPLVARVLEVVEYDQDTASVRPFQVVFRDGEWTIPSHHDYPADAQDRMADLAAAVASMEKDTIRSDDKSDHEALGVLDPEDETITTLVGRGTKVRLREAEGGRPLAEFIIGEPIEDREGQFYIRLPNKRRVYGVDLGDLDLSTRFADWIDTDLVELRSDSVRRLTFDRRKVDPDRGVILPGETTTVLQDDPPGGSGSDSWTIEGLGPGQEVDSTEVSDVIRAIDDLSIVGVRPLPRTGTDRTVLRSLMSKGFYPVRKEGDGESELLSNEGRVSVSTDEGIIYNIQFGEVTFASGEALTAGEEEAGDGDEDPEAGDAESDAPEGSAAEEQRASGDGDDRTESRFLMISAEFDPSLIPEKGPETDTDDGEWPEDVFARAPDDPIRVEREQRAREEAERLREEREQRIREGQERVDELNRRYAAWYYVVPGDDFREVFVDRAALIRDPGEDSEGEDSGTITPPGLPGGSGFNPADLGLPTGRP